MCRRVDRVRQPTTGAASPAARAGPLCPLHAATLAPRPAWPGPCCCGHSFHAVRRPRPAGCSPCSSQGGFYEESLHDAIRPLKPAPSPGRRGLRHSAASSRPPAVWPPPRRDPWQPHAFLRLPDAHAPRWPPSRPGAPGSLGRSASACTTVSGAAPPRPPGSVADPTSLSALPPLVTPPTPAPQNECGFTFIARFARVLPSVGPEPDPRPTRVRVRACIRVHAFLLIVSLFLQKVAFLARLRPGRPARVGASRGLQPVLVQYVGEAGAASAVRWLGRNGGRGAWPRAWVERPGWRSLRWPRGAVAAVTRCAPREGRGPTAAPGQAGSRGHVPPIKTPFTSAAVKLYSDFSTHGVNSNLAFFSVAAKAATTVRPSAAGQVLGARPRRGALQELGIQAGLGIKLPARGPDWGAIRPPSVGPGPQQPPAAGMPPLRPLPEPSLPQSSLGRSPVWVDSVACGL